MRLTVQLKSFLPNNNLIYIWVTMKPSYRNQIMVPTILGSVFLAVFLYHLPKTLGYDMELKRAGFWKFQDVSRVKFTTLEVKTKLNIFFAFFNENERLYWIIIRTDGWKWNSGTTNPASTQLSSTEFTKYWFSWNGTDVQFGLGQVPGVNVLGTKTGISDTVQFKYTSISITFPNNATIRFPDSTVYQAYPGATLSSPTSVLTTSTVMACGFKCLSRPMCYAFNYRVSEFNESNCQLHGTKASLKPGNIMPTPFSSSPNTEWNYYFRM
ncbi:hypothetical protein LOTGIDRAFT_173555 [Lottia gigantea]|uniref:Apple domain-containing protein n=1 Tax=Lottia gigantea TaxID=225164 RepID=V4AR41_LOTGI|nr:hypothetical protein LOTGIDRAFT_173555 [Lottia gigantea]ESO99717.1 hypothetical protein LOTGIDRAFT_173555 [Lottia gigantea]